jgi:hypothetical protein
VVCAQASSAQSGPGECDREGTLRNRVGSPASPVDGKRLTGDTSVMVPARHGGPHILVGIAGGKLLGCGSRIEISQ